MQTFYALLLVLAIGTSQFVTAEDPWSDLEHTIEDRMKSLKNGEMSELQTTISTLNDETNKQLETIKYKDDETKKRTCMSQNHTESLLKLANIYNETITCLQKSKQEAQDQVNTVKNILGETNTNDEEGIAATHKIRETFMNATQDCFMNGVTKRRELTEQHCNYLRLCAL